MAVVWFIKRLIFAIFQSTVYGKISEKVWEFVTWFNSLINFYLSNFIIDRVVIIIWIKHILKGDY